MFVNYAHRGASEYAPENTISAFDLGLKMGANGIEFDIQKSKDGVLIVYHDADLKKCDMVGCIADYTLEELKQMYVMPKNKSYSSKDKLITFEEFLDLYSKKDITFAIELKVQNIEKEVLELSKKYNVIEKSIFTSFDFSNLVELRKLDKDIKLGYLVYGNEEDLYDKLSQINAYQVCIDANTATKEMVDNFHKKGYTTRAWGVKNEDLMKKAVDIGINGGMTVNFPDKLTDYLNTSK